MRINNLSRIKPLGEAEENTFRKPQRPGIYRMTQSSDAGGNLPLTAHEVIAKLAQEEAEKDRKVADAWKIIKDEEGILNKKPSKH